MGNVLSPPPPPHFAFSHRKARIHHGTLFTFPFPHMVRRVHLSPVHLSLPPYGHDGSFPPSGQAGSIHFPHTVRPVHHFTIHFPRMVRPVHHFTIHFPHMVRPVHHFTIPFPIWSDLIGELVFFPPALGVRAKLIGEMVKWIRVKDKPIGEMVKFFPSYIARTRPALQGSSVTAATQVASMFKACWCNPRSGILMVKWFKGLGPN